jgi:hypothetical protein
MQSTMDVARPETVVPDRALQQRMAALEKADRVRLARAQLKRDLKKRRVSICDVLADPPEWIETMPVLDLLLAVPKIGRVKAMAMLGRGGISTARKVGGLESRKVVGLTERQRGELLAALAPYRGR